MATANKQEMHVYVVDGRKTREACGEQTHRIEIVVGRWEFCHLPPGHSCGCMSEAMAMERANAVASILGVSVEAHPLHG